MICQRCAKDKSGIHTCTPSQLVRDLEQQVAALRADAERYRWLREGGDFRSWQKAGIVKWFSTGTVSCCGGYALDAAIDAARSK